jgi:hypothetical protein
MPKRQFAVWFASGIVVAGFAALQLRAQNTQPPNAYSLTEVISMFGPPQNMQIYRDGTKVVMDNIGAPQAGAKATHTRTLYDLEAHTTYSWSMTDRSGGCSTGNFSGDWGDPFASSADMNAELAKNHATEAGTETVNGFTTKIYQFTTNDGVFKAWIDAKSSFVVKLQMAPKTGPTTTLTEVKQVTFAKPPASLFVLPPACAAAAKAPRPPTESERIAAETGDDPKNFANGTMGQSSQNSCTVLFRVVQAVAMKPVTGFQVALDRNYDIDHPPSYTFGVGVDGHITYAGGSIQELTSQVRDGVLRIDNAPQLFNLELAFGKAGSSSAVLYRQCAGPQTVLLYVMKNPAKTSDGGDWLWVKSGKFAAAGPAR